MREFEAVVDEIENRVYRKPKGTHISHYSLPPRPLYLSQPDFPSFPYPFSSYVRCPGSSGAKGRLGGWETGGTGEIGIVERVTNDQYTDDKSGQ